MRKNTLRATTALFLASSIMIAGCNQTSNERTGALLGAIGGAIIGSQFGDGKGRIVATAIGTAAGLVVGEWLGGMLEPQEREQVGHITTDSLDTKNDGESAVWQSVNSRKSAEITPLNTRQVAYEIDLQRPKNVSSPKAMTVIGEVRFLQVNATLRAGPSTEADRIGGLVAGSRLNVIGSVNEGQWLVVGYDEKMIGYIYHALVGTSPPQNDMAKLDASPMPSAPKTDDAIVKSEVASPDTDFDARNADLELETDHLMVETTCRDLQLTINDGVKREQNDYSACKNPNGVWEIG